MTRRDGQIWKNTGDDTLMQIDIRGNVIREVKIASNLCCINYTDLTHRGVYSVTRDGQKTTFYRHSDLLTPRGIAVDAIGNVYVADMSSDNIHRISSDGKKHAMILQKEDGIRKPCGLCLNKDTNQLLVRDNYGRRFDVYGFD